MRTLMNRYPMLLLRSATFLFAVCLLLSSCQKDDDTVATPKTIADRILEDDQFRLLRVAANYAGFDGAFKSANMTLLFLPALYALWFRVRRPDGAASRAPAHGSVQEARMPVQAAP